MDYERIAPVMGRLWAPVAAVTSRWQGQVNAQLCVSIAAASIVPERPRVIIQIYKTNYSHEMILRSGAFALNFAGANQLSWIRDYGMVSRRDGRQAGRGGAYAGRHRQPAAGRRLGLPGLPGGEYDGRRGYDLLPGRGG